MIRRRRRPPRRLEADAELLLAAMVDMMVNVLLFLLTLYGAGPGAGLDEVELPEAKSQAPVVADVHLTLTPLRIVVDGSEVLTLAAGADGPQLPEDSAALDALQTRLSAALSRGESPPPLAVEIDRRVPWSVVRPVLDLATRSGFTDLRFSVASVEEKPGPG